MPASLLRRDWHSVKPTCRSTGALASVDNIFGAFGNPSRKPNVRMHASVPQDSRDKHAVVIGAGFAGLAAARRLLDAQCRVTVLEGGDRVGGRAHTAQVSYLQTIVWQEPELPLAQLHLNLACWAKHYTSQGPSVQAIHVLCCRSRG